MTIPVLIILGALWAAVLVPPLLRARSDRRSTAIGDYAHSLGALKTSNRTISSMSRSAAGLVNGQMHSPAVNRAAHIKKRRRDIFTGLLVSAGVTFLLAVLVGNSMLWFIHILIDIALGAYVYMLIQIKEQQRLRRMSAPSSFDD